MIKIWAKHDPYWDTGHLGLVINEMTLAGDPTIRVVLYNKRLFALEGSHRLAAAHYLKLRPKLVILTPDTTTTSVYLDKIMDTLPCYDFDEVLVITEKRLSTMQNVMDNYG